MENKISVIIPVYNVEKFLYRCIDSVIRQTYQNLEIILIDDGSKDASGSICDEYSEKDSRVKVIHQINKGLSAARNLGIEESTGELLTFVDGDDSLVENALELMFRAMMDSEAQIACCLFRRTTDPSFRQVRRRTRKRDSTIVISQVEALRKMLKASEITCSAWGKLYERKLFQDIRYPAVKFCEDLGTTYKVFAKAKKVTLVRSEGYCYYKRAGSLQESDFIQDKYIELQFAREQKAFLDNCFPELRTATTDRLVSVCFHLLFGMKNDTSFSNERRELIRIIRQYRRYLCFRRDVSLKTGAGCLSSYLGFKTTYIMYKLFDIRGRIFK